MLKADAITDGHGLAALAEEWAGLVDRSSAATIFQSFEWNHAWWEELGSKRRDRRLLVICIRAEGRELVGLAPMMTSSWHGSPLRRLAFLGAGASDYCDIVARDDAEEEVCETLYRFLAAGSFWHIGDLSCLREGAVIRRFPPRDHTPLEYSDFAQERCPYLEFPAECTGDRWAALLKGYSKKVRSHIGYYDRKLDAVYSVERGIAKSEDQLDDVLTTLFELHRRRWNSRWLPGVLGSRSVQTFHRRVAALFLARGWLRLHWIGLDSQIEAVLYCFAFRDRTCYYQGGFEPTLHKLSLGTVLTSHAIKTAIDEGRAEFDFLRGEEPYKDRWTHGVSRMNTRRIMARRGSHLLGLAERAHFVESSIERRFKHWMHHAFAKTEGKTGERDRDVS